MIPSHRKKKSLILSQVNHMQFTLKGQSVSLNSPNHNFIYILQVILTVCVRQDF